MSKKIALIDGYGFVFRAYHSLPPLTNPQGVPVGAVYGFTNMLIKLLAGLDVSHLAIAFDSGSKSFRNEIYPQYKANRPECPEDLKPQFPIIRQSAEALNLEILEKTGFEADDLIATMAKKAKAMGYEVLIVSSDKDLMQLVDDKISMYDAMKNKLIKSQQVEEKFFVKPNQVLDMLALIGDSSDNIPGIRGIGPKTAAELLNKFGDLENIFSNLDQITQKKRNEALTNGIESARLSKILATLKEDVEINIEPEDLIVKNIDPHKLIAFLQEHGFRSLVTKVSKEFNVKAENKTPNQNNSNSNEANFKDIKLTKLTTNQEIEKLTQTCLVNGIATIDHYDNFITISSNKFGQSTTEIFYFESKSPSNQQSLPDNNDLFSFNDNKAKNNQDQQFDLNILQPILENDAIKKVFFDAKSFLKLARVNAYEDILLINHLLKSTVKNHLRDLIDLNLNQNIEESDFGLIFSEIDKDHQPKEFEDFNKKIQFLCFKNFAISQLYKIFAPQIFDNKLNEAYNIYEKPLLDVLAQIEMNGVMVDGAKLKELSADFGHKIHNLSQEIYKISNCEFNIASSQQVGDILFNKLQLESSKKSRKTGALSTNAKILEELDDQGHEIAGKILEFRKFSKLKNTYTDALPKEINPITKRIHTNFSSTSTITGRLSSSNPNLQNIPIRTSDGRKIRQCFISPKDHYLISADYSQIELRIIAQIAKINNLIKAFKEDKDIHRITASEVFKIAESEVTDQLRYRAKAINFGIIYGISAFGLARQLQISRSEASDYIKSYFTTYPEIETYMANYIKLAQENGFVQTISKRKCFLHNINHKNPIIRKEAERLAINAPIQGSAADIMKKAMIITSQKLQEAKLKSKIILQIHDELIIETPKDEIEITTKIVKEGMEQAAILELPLKVDIAVTNSWK